MIRSLSTRSLLLFVTVAASTAAQDYTPEIADASKDAELALQGFALPEGMSGSLLAAEPALANPVAFFPAAEG